MQIAKLARKKYLFDNNNTESPFQKNRQVLLKNMLKLNNGK